MDINELIDMIECVVCHKCPLKLGTSKRCVTCEIGYRFISENPLQLSCSDVICSKCKRDEQIECPRDGLANVGDKSYAAERIISKKKKELMQNLRQKVNDSFKLFEGIAKLKF